MPYLQFELVFQLQPLRCCPLTPLLQLGIMITIGGILFHCGGQALVNMATQLQPEQIQQEAE